MLWLDKLAYGPPDGKRLPSPIDICNTRGIANALPALEDPFHIFFEAVHVVVKRKNLRRELIPQFARMWEKRSRKASCTRYPHIDDVWMSSQPMSRGAMIKPGSGYKLK